MSNPVVAEVQDKEWKSADVWLAEHERFLEQVRNAATTPLLFIGDSITQAWLSVGKRAWAKCFAPLGALNLGLGGDEVQHVLWRVENGEVDGLSPKLVVLLIGTNNIGNAGHGGVETAQGIELLVRTLRSKLPETHILVHKVFPRDEHAGTPFRRQVHALNQAIAELANEEKVSVFDVNHLFLEDDGTIAMETMPDFLHLSSKSYERWSQLLLPEIKRLMEG